MHRAKILPLLLEHGGEKVERKRNVGTQLLGSLFHRSDGATHAHNLFQLELDRALGLVELGAEILSFADEGGELSGLVQTRSQQTGDATDDTLGSKKGLK